MARKLDEYWEDLDEIIRLPEEDPEFCTLCRESPCTCAEFLQHDEEEEDR